MRGIRNHKARKSAPRLLQMRFAIAIKELYWNLSIGYAMMEYAFFLSKEMDYEQTELEVIVNNILAGGDKSAFNEALLIGYYPALSEKPGL